MEQKNRIVDIALELQALARNGLTYTKDIYDKERFENISKLAAELIEIKTELDGKVVLDIFNNQKGYQTPKVETRGVIFQDNKLLLVKEKNKWALPGGWMDYNMKVSTNTIKEVEEETGLQVQTKRIIAVQNRNIHNYPKTIFEVIKIFVECEVITGSFKENIETTEAKYFSLKEIKGLELDVDKTTIQQIEMCFFECENKNTNVVYD